MSPTEPNQYIAHSPSILLVDIIYNQNTANSVSNRIDADAATTCLLTQLIRFKPAE